MGRFKAEAVIIRHLQEVTITFYDKESIYVFPRGCGNGAVFHRWWSPKGYYTKHWKRFREALRYNKHLDMEACFRIASYYEVLHEPAYVPPKLNGKKIKYIYK